MRKTNKDVTLRETLEKDARSAVSFSANATVKQKRRHKKRRRIPPVEREKRLAMPLPYDEEIVLERENRSFRLQYLRDRKDRLEVLLDRLKPIIDDTELLQHYREEIADIEAERDAIEGVLAAEGLSIRERGHGSPHVR